MGDDKKQEIAPLPKIQERWKMTDDKKQEELRCSHPALHKFKISSISLPKCEWCKKDIIQIAIESERVRHEKELKECQKKIKEAIYSTYCFNQSQLNNEIEVIFKEVFGGEKK